MDGIARGNHHFRVRAQTGPQIHVRVKYLRKVEKTCQSRAFNLFSELLLAPWSPMTDLTNLLDSLLEKHNARSRRNPSEPKDEFLKEAYRIVSFPCLSLRTPSLFP